MDTLVEDSKLQSFILNDLKGSEDLFNQVLTLLQAELQTFKYDQTDVQKIQALAHKLKSSCAYFGAVRLQKAFEEIERECHEVTIEELNAKVSNARELIDSTFELISTTAAKIFFEGKMNA